MDLIWSSPTHAPLDKSKHGPVEPKSPHFVGSLVRVVLVIPSGNLNRDWHAKDLPSFLGSSVVSNARLFPQQSAALGCSKIILNPYLGFARGFVCSGFTTKIMENRIGNLHHIEQPSYQFRVLFFLCTGNPGKGHRSSESLPGVKWQSPVLRPCRLDSCVPIKVAASRGSTHSGTGKTSDFA